VCSDGIALIWTIIMLQPTALAQFRACFAQVKDLWPVRYADLYVPAGCGAAR
jgi:hypothetical protein